MDEVEVEIEHDRDWGVLPDGGDGGQHARGGGARIQAALGGELVHHAIGQRVAERNSEFEDVHPGAVEGEGEPAGDLEVGVARADVDDEAFAAGLAQLAETLHDAVHRRPGAVAIQRAGV